MTVNDILKSVQAAGGILRIDGGKLVLEVDSGVIGQALKESIRAHKEEIIRVLSPPALPAAPVSKEAQAKAEVAAILEIALDAGWEPDQLDELAQIMKVFWPCRVGSVRPEAIGILLLDADGEIRGGNRFYNMRVPQPWLKRVDSQSAIKINKDEE